MVFIYTAEDCVKCETLKAKYKADGIQYVERSAGRLKQPQDDIDKEALVEAALQNEVLPVIVEVFGGEADCVGI